MDLEAHARQLLDENRYVVLGTADEHGDPWVTPVFYAMDGWGSLLWLSAPDTRHSRNVAVRPSVSLVVYDSQVPVGGGQAVYLTARAGLVPEGEAAAAVAAYSAGCVPKGAPAWTLEQVTGAARLRLYRATIAECWVFDPTLPHDGRTEVHLTS